MYVQSMIAIILLSSNFNIRFFFFFYQNNIFGDFSLYYSNSKKQNWTNTRQIKIIKKYTRDIKKRWVKHASLQQKKNISKFFDKKKKRKSIQQKRSIINEGTMSISFELDNFLIFCK